MRPIPKAKHIPSIIILVAVSLFASLLAWQDDRLSPPQIATSAALQAQENPDSYEFDALLGKGLADGQMRQAYPQAFLKLIALSTPPGSTDPAVAFHILVGPLTLIFLLGMYALLWRQTLSSATATFVSVMSVAIIRTLGDSEWGVGSLSSVTPEGIIIALSPMIMLCYLRYFHRSTLPLVFVLIGLTGNFSLAGAANLGIIALLTFLACHKFSRHSLIIGVGCVFMFIIAALPEISHMLTVKYNVTKTIEPFSIPTAQDFAEAFTNARMRVMYPALFKPIAQWIGYTAIMMFVSLLVLWRLDQFRTRDIDLWVWMVIWGFVVTFVFHGIALAVVLRCDEPAPFFNFLQASSWIMLPLYVLTARALTQIFRILAKKNRHILRWILAGVMIAWLLPSDAVRPLRRLAYNAAAKTTAGKDNIYLQDILEKTDKNNEFMAIASWVRQNTPQQSMFITNKTLFRMAAQRSILTADDDLAVIYYFAPEIIGDWNYSCRKSQQLLSEPLSPERVASSINRLAARPQYANVQQWYLITISRTLPENPDAMEEISSPKWGKYWRIIRVPVARPATMPAK